MTGFFRDVRWLSWNVVVAMAMLFGACGRSAPDPQAVKPFEQAIGEYLEAGNMDMAVHRVVELNVEDGKATATVSLHAREVPTVKVRWRFTFSRDGGGAWQVTEHRQ
jgi:hypothetical protein